MNAPLRVIAALMNTVVLAAVGKGAPAAAPAPVNPAPGMIPGVPTLLMTMLGEAVKSAPLQDESTILILVRRMRPV